MQTLVFGAGGMLARELLEVLRSSSWPVHAASREGCDITDATAVSTLVREVAPAIIFNCAAYTKVDRAEEEPDAAFAVNARGAGTIAAEAARCGATLVHFSTNTVFDGIREEAYSEGDAVGPVGAYGASKYAGEVAVAESGARAYLLRTAHLYGAGGYNFFDAVLNRARQGLPLKVVDDQTATPTWTRDLAAQTLRICRSAPPGVYHVVADGQTTWYDAAVLALRSVGLASEVLRVSTAEYAALAPRPRNGILSHRLLDGLRLYSMRPWDVALTEWLETKHEHRAA